MVEPNRPQAMWGMRVTCWISKATRAHTHTCIQKYVIRIAFSLQQWFRERASVLRSTYGARLVLYCREHPLRWPTKVY